MGAVVQLDRRPGGLQAEPVMSLARTQLDGSYSEEQIWSLIRDSYYAPQWRKNAEVEMAYYDGDQLNLETLRRMKQNGIPPVIVNMIGPAIDSVVGFQQMIRTDPRVLPENDESIDGAEALNEELKTISRNADFDDGFEDAFATAAKIGLGWAEVSRNTDPMEYMYRVAEAPWREFSYDWRARRRDLSDARYIIRRQWYDVDYLQVMYPQHAEALTLAQNTWPDGWLNMLIGLDDTTRSSRLAHGHEQEMRWTLEEEEWRAQGRHRAAVYEILYRVPAMVTAIRFKDGRTIEYDKENPMHNRAIIDRAAIFVKGMSKRLRCAWYAGSVKLSDVPMKRNRPHYIPIFAKRKDSDRSPYGLIRPMTTPQEAINARTARILFDQSARRYAADDDAFEDVDEARQELARPDALVMMNSTRLREKGLYELTTQDMTQGSFNMLQEHKTQIRDVTGIHAEFRGETQGEAKSGVAIDSLIEQVRQVLGKLDANYNKARRMGAEDLLAMRIDDMAQFDDYEVNVEKPITGGRPRMVTLNRASVHAGGPRENDVAQLRTRVALAEVPATHTYRQQKLSAWAEIMKALPPELQAALAGFTLKQTDHPDIDEAIEIARSVTGQGPEPRDPKLREAIEQQRAEQAQLRKLMEELQLRLMDADLRGKLATARSAEAKARKLDGTDTRLSDAKVDEIYHGMRLADADLAVRRMEARGRLVGEAARLQKESNADRAKNDAQAKSAKSA